MQIRANCAAQVTLLPPGPEKLDLIHMPDAPVSQRNGTYRTVRPLTNWMNVLKNNHKKKKTN